MAFSAAGERRDADRPPAPPSGLAVGAPRDACEQNADRVAAGLSRTPNRVRITGGARADVARAGGHEQATDELSAESDVVANALRAPAGSMPSGAREEMERHFGYDFSRVRVHADEAAAEACRALHANAFTVGGHLVFGAGKHSPGSSVGRRLLAHELTHIVQQSAAGGHGAGLIQRDQKQSEQEVKSVISPNVKLRQGAVQVAEGQLARRMDKRKAEIAAMIEELGPEPKSDAARKRRDALQKDLNRDLDDIIRVPDSRYVNKDLRNDVLESYRAVGSQRLKLRTAEQQWSRYDPIFAGPEVAAALGKKSLSAAELKALIAQESGDLTKNDQTGRIAGIAQLGPVEEKLGGGKPGDRKIPEKAILIAARLLSIYADQLDKALTVKPTGQEWTKFVMGGYNAGVNAVVTAQKEAIKMGRDGKTWESLRTGGEQSPLYKAIMATYPRNTDYEKAYQEKSKYPSEVFGRLP